MAVSALVSDNPAVSKAATTSDLTSTAAAVAFASVVIGVSLAFKPVNSPIVKGLPSPAVPITTSGWTLNSGPLPVTLEPSTSPTVTALPSVSKPTGAFKLSTLNLVSAPLVFVRL